ncbi:S8 family serine peptidase, partial [Pseudooceanicola nanhaiensis]|uniref:S8 family serine peptidase n=1 Tax=Pseudooceanicola nanhaiensis TaxID=375761 RepID=UPI001CD210AB
MSNSTEQDIPSTADQSATEETQFLFVDKVPVEETPALTFETDLEADKGTGPDAATANSARPVEDAGPEAAPAVSVRTTASDAGTGDARAQALAMFATSDRDALTLREATQSAALTLRDSLSNRVSPDAPAFAPLSDQTSQPARPAGVDFSLAAAPIGRVAEMLPTAGDGPISFNMALPSDHLFAQQWYLQNSNAALFDLNVTEVWDSEGQTYTGAGVDVAIIDDAVDRAHADLNDNYSTTKDWDFADDDSFPDGVDGENHGTAVAGIIAAERNDVGTVGVAYDATIFGFRVESSGATSGPYDAFLTNLLDAVQVASGEVLLLGIDRTADIVNMSNGTQVFGNFYSLLVPTASLPDQVVSAFEYGAENGRDGLGTIFVKAAGNGRADGLDANGSEWNASRYSISVAAVNQDGYVSSYSTEGANLFVSAFGTAGEIVTTDRRGAEGYNSSTDSDYVFDFNGTSAATPMVSGVVALMLEANPDLGWRDVQDILAYSARHVGTEVGGGVAAAEANPWFFNGAEGWNGGGLHFSQDYGFGLIDAHAAVRLAETWGGTAQTSANDALFTTDLINSTVSLAGTSTSYTFTPGDMLVETIEVQLSYSHTWLGDMNLELTSPTGTTIDLIKENYGTSADITNDTYTWSTNAFWGEEASGSWTITLTDDAIADNWVITDLQVFVWGDDSSYDTDASNDRNIITEEFSDYAGNFGHSTALSPLYGSTGTLNTAALTTGSDIDMSTGSGTIDGVAVTLSGFTEIYGGDGDDTIVGNASSDVISGMRGDDVLIGGTGTELLLGGAGDDSITSKGGSDTLTGGDGNDTLVGSGHGVEYSGGGGDDLFQLDSTGSSTLSGGDGSDTVDLVAFGYAGILDSPARIINLDLGYSFDGGAYQGDWEGLENLLSFANTSVTLIGNASDNLLQGSSRNDTLLGEDGADTLLGLDGDDSINGGFGADSLVGGAGNDLIDGGYGNNADTLVGGAGNDTLIGGASGDSLDGGDGDDVLQVRYIGSSTIVGGAGNDTMDLWTNGLSVTSGPLRILDVDKGYSYNGGAFQSLWSEIENIMSWVGSSVTMVGNASDNLLQASIEDDTLFGADGADTLLGMSGHDTIDGGAGDDTIDAGKGHDTVDGGDGADSIVGGTGDDELHGGANADTIKGGGGNDTVWGDNGRDVIYLNNGADLFNDNAQDGTY